MARAKAGMMPNQATDYRSYLVRLWRVKEGDRDVWRASLQDPQSGERISFASLDALFAFLRDQTQGPPDTRGCANAGACENPGPAPDKWHSQGKEKGMIVNRRTFVAKRGHIEEAYELLAKERESSVVPVAMRIYVPQIAPFDMIAVELEFEDWEQYHKMWAEWSPGEDFWEKWYALTENGGTNEVWRLVE